MSARQFLTPTATVFLAVLYHVVRGEIFRPGCEVPYELTPTNGDYSYLCIAGGIFQDQVRSWLFVNTTLRSTIFTNVTFQNTPGIATRFVNSSLTNVWFENCTFESYSRADPSYSSELIFDNVELNSVSFSNCSFAPSVTLSLKNFKVDGLIFEDVNVRKPMLLEDGTMKSVFFANLTTGDQNTTEENADILIKKVTAVDFTLSNSTIKGNMQLNDVYCAECTLHNSTLDKISCDTDLEGEPTSVLPSSFSTFMWNARLENLSLTSGMSCMRSRWTGLITSGFVKFGGVWNMSNSIISTFLFSNMTALNADSNTTAADNPSNSTCSKTDFSGAKMTNGVVTNSQLGCDVDFSGATLDNVQIDQLLGAPDTNFSEALFLNAGSDTVNGSCCVSFCASEGCTCNNTLLSFESDICRAAMSKSNCFPSSATLTSDSGIAVRMDALEVGDSVHVGRGMYSDVFFFGHRDASRSEAFVRISHDGSQRTLRLTAGHYLYVNGKLSAAGYVQKGDNLRGADGKDNLVVKTVSVVMAKGIFAPASLHGDLVVDGVMVSSYTDAVHPRVAHFVLAPLRALYRVGFRQFLSKLAWFDRHTVEPLARRLGLPRGPVAVTA